MKTVFLGGTWNDSTWRENLILLLSNNIEYHNPIVKEWKVEDQEKEIYHRNNDDFCLYVLTPEMIGFYSIAEVVDDSNKRPGKTILCVLDNQNNKSFEKHFLKGMDMLKKMVAANGAKVFDSLEEVAEFLNNSVEN